MTESYLDHRLADFLDLVAARRPAPGGGGVAAVTVMLAASLVAMAARFSVDLPDCEHVVDEAEGLRARAGPLADEDARAYEGVIAAYADLRVADSDDHRSALRTALTAATHVPLAVAEIGAATCVLASRLAKEGKRDLRGDATTAVLLAEAATRSAAHLVSVNVQAGGGDEVLLRRSAEAAAAARRSVAGLDQRGGGWTR